MYENKQDITISELDILESLPVPLLVVNEALDILYINHIAENFLSVSRKVIASLNLENFFEDKAWLKKSILQVQQQKTTLINHEVRLILRNSIRKNVMIYVAPFINQSDKVTLVVHDLSFVETVNNTRDFDNISRSVENMAMLLAHEIKNPLSGIQGAAQLLQQTVPAEDRMLTELICTEVTRIEKLVDRKSILNQEKLELEPLNIHSILDHVKGVAETGFAAHIKIRNLYDPSLPLVHGNRDALIQLFINLLKNAAEAVEERGENGEITIITRYHPDFIMQFPQTGRRITLPLRIAIRDNGSGINEEFKDRLFEPFISTKAGGTGVGLTICKKIVHEHGGIIKFDRLEDETEINVFLPIIHSHR